MPPTPPHKPTPPESSSATHRASEKEASKHVKNPSKPTEAITKEVERVEEARKIDEANRAEEAKVPGAVQPPITTVELEVKDVTEGNVRQRLFEEFAKKYPRPVVEQTMALNTILEALPAEFKKYKNDGKGGPISVKVKSPADEPPYHEIEITGMTKIEETKEETK